MAFIPRNRILILDSVCCRSTSAAIVPIRVKNPSWFGFTNTLVIIVRSYVEKVPQKERSINPTSDGNPKNGSNPAITTIALRRFSIYRNTSNSVICEIRKKLTAVNESNVARRNKSNRAGSKTTLIKKMDEKSKKRLA